MMLATFFTTIIIFVFLFNLPFAWSQVVADEDEKECLDHLVNFYYTKSSELKEPCWTKMGITDTSVKDGDLYLTTGEKNVTGGIWGKYSVSNSILQPNDFWEFKLSFIVSSMGPVSKAGLAIWLTTKDAIMNQPEKRGVNKNNFTGLGIVFEALRIYPKPNNETDPNEPHYQLFASAGENVNIDFWSSETGAKNRTCIEQMYTWSNERVFYLVIHKIGSDIHTEVNTKDESVDCDMHFSIKTLTQNVKRMPPLYLGITAWTGNETPATFVLDKLASEIREANQDPFEVEEEIVKDRNGYRDSGVDDHTGFHKSIVIGAMALVGVILTIAMIVFIWICKFDVPCCRPHRRQSHISNAAMHREGRQIGAKVASQGEMDKLVRGSHNTKKAGVPMSNKQALMAALLNNNASSAGKPTMRRYVAPPRTISVNMAREGSANSLADDKTAASKSLRGSRTDLA